MEFTFSTASSGPSTIVVRVAEWFVVTVITKLDEFDVVVIRDYLIKREIIIRTVLWV